MDRRVARIADKLAAVRAGSELPRGFGVDAHRFELRAPLSVAAVVEFEARHEVELPDEYRMFLLEISDGGAGPGTGLRRLADSCGDRSDVSCRPGHLSRPSPYVPGGRYADDWEELYEDPLGAGRVFLPGTITVAGHGCSLVTQLIVTGPARGRLMNLDVDGLGPYVVEDADFLSWYERWLDEVVAGCDVGWFGEQLPLNEAQLIEVVALDPSPQRRLRAAESLLYLPAVGEGAWMAITQAMATDVDPVVRAELMWLLHRQRIEPLRRPVSADAAADAIAQYARSSSPVSLLALEALARLTFDDVEPELFSGDVERRRIAARLLAQNWSIRQVPADLLDGTIRILLHDPDPIVRSRAAQAVRRRGLTELRPLLLELIESETDGWVLDYLDWSLDRPTVRTESDTQFVLDPWS